MQKKILLLSLDAMGRTDLDAMAALPGFQKLMKQGAWCGRNQSVYPSLTFPSHASIITGCVPGNHGIVNNYVLEPGRKLARWQHYASALKRKALWDYAARADKKVLSLSWPVSGGANIRYNLPEMNPAKPKIWNARNFFAQMHLLFTQGSPGVAARSLMLHPALSKAWFFGTQPDLDKGMMSMIKKNLDRYPSDIAMFHLYGMDDAKHHYGADSAQAKEYLPLYDELVSHLISRVDAGIKRGEDITLVVTGDHSQRDISRSVYGNMLMAELGYCQWENEELVKWDAWMDSCDGMAYVYVHESCQGTEKEKEMLRDIKRAFSACKGIAKVMEPEEFIPLGCGRDAALVLEAADGYGFESGWASAQAPDYILPSQYKALHGYLPTLPDYETLFFAYGPSVRRGKIEKMSITDILPTLCDWLDLPTDPVDGKILQGLLKK